MNRENKRKTFEKGYYKTHRCNDTFSCRVCDRLVFPTPTGGDHRNHCPNCLSSLHVDQEPGDRAADCGGIMDPIGVWVRKKEEWAVIHRCRRCGKLSSNRVAGDEADVNCPQTPLSASLSPGEDRAAHRRHGRQRQPGDRRQDPLKRDTEDVPPGASSVFLEEGGLTVEK